MTHASSWPASWDFVVVGAGPAGSLAARELARRGQAVLLVERTTFPRYKVCGCCLNPRALRLLSQVGLEPMLNSLGGIPLRQLRLAANEKNARVRIPTGMAVSREALDQALVREAVQAGVTFLPNTVASRPTHQPDSDRRIVRLRTGKQEQLISTTFILAANGLGGKLDEYDLEASAPVWNEGSRIGAGVVVDHVPVGYEPHTIYMACGDGGYVGLVQIEGQRLDVAAAFDPMAVKAAGGTGPLAERILAQAGFPGIGGLADLPWKGTPHLTRSANRLGSERTLLLGDAAGYIEPFTGEGMAWAFASATAVIPLALQGAKHWDKTIIDRWENQYRQSVKGRQAVCRLTATLLRRPRPTRWLVRTLSLMPWLARPFMQYMYRI